MEQNTKMQISRWTEIIATNKGFSTVTAELTECLRNTKPNSSVNRGLQTLLVQVCIAAHKYEERDYEWTIQVAKLTKCLCANMTEVANYKRFFSSIYHIVARILKMNFFKADVHQRASDICDYLTSLKNVGQPEAMMLPSEIYEPISRLWYKVALDYLKSNLIDKSNLSKLLMPIEKDLHFTKLAYPNGTYDLFARILLYVKKFIATQTKDKSTDTAENFNDWILNYLIESRITFDHGKSEKTWHLICQIIPMMIGKNITATNVNSMARSYERYFKVFQSCVVSNDKYADCYEYWRSLALTLLKPVEKFSSSDVSDMDICRRRLYSLFNEEPEDAVQRYSYGALLLLTSVLNYWEACSKDPEIMEHITTDMVLAMVRLLDSHSEIYTILAVDDCLCGESSCRVKTDIYNEVSLKVRCLAFVSRRSMALDNAKLRSTMLKMVESSYRMLKIMKSKGCKQWSALWRPWGASIYNSCLVTENSVPSFSIDLYTYLYRSIVRFETLNCQISIWGMDDPLGTVLHRLTSVCIKSGNFNRAKSVSALNGLVSANKDVTKAYRDWALIKEKEEVTSMTILECLRNHEPEIRDLRLKDYDLTKVCLLEMKALQESMKNMSSPMIAVIGELEALKASSENYAKAVQLLGYHLLNFKDPVSIRKYLQKAQAKYDREEKRSLDFRYTSAILKLWEFVELTRELELKTKSEMDSVLFFLKSGRKSDKTKETNVKDVVPAYSTMNMTVTSELKSSLEQPILKWRKLMNAELGRSTELSRFTIHAIRIAGEYARLYHFQDLETEAWKLLREYGVSSNDNYAIIYATSRSLTSESFDPDWIDLADEFAKINGNSESRDTMEIVNRYKLSLANFYYENGERAKADELYEDVLKNSKISFMEDTWNFLLATDIEMNHRLGDDVQNDDQTKYASMIIQCLYTLLSMDDDADKPIFQHKENQIYNYEILIDFTNNLALRMNSLLSFREISMHLIKRLSMAQKLGADLRVAECLKFLCYIDLSRGRLDDCEVKLQGLEHILEIEAFQTTMRSRLSPVCFSNDKIVPSTTSNFQYVDVVRDIGQSDASPVLKKKVFEKPDFMLHQCDCSCLKCTNTRYQYLVLAATHIRAQLFSLQRNSTAAFQHYHGAMEIRKCIYKKRDNVVGDGFVSSGSQRRRDAIEYVLFHLDYCRFLDWAVPSFSPDDLKAIAMDALDICDKYNLKNHPIYMSVNEILFQYRFERVFTREDYAIFTVPDVSDMDVKVYEEKVQEDPLNCVTPMREIIEKRPRSVRRRKTPPFLALDRVPMDLNDDEDPTLTQVKAKRQLRRRIHEDDDYSEENENETKNQNGESSSLPKIKVETPTEKKTKVPDSSNRVTRKTVTKSLVKIPEDLMEIGKLKIEEDTTKTRETRTKETRTRGKKKFFPSLEDKIVDVTATLNNLSMEKREIATWTPNSAVSVKKSIKTIASDTSEDEINSNGRRGSARLRTKKNSAKNAEMEKTSASNSEEANSKVGPIKSSRKRATNSQNT